MTVRKRRRPTPGFGIPPPYQPITGEQADLREYGLFPYCAMVQVAEQDTYEDYVICRGFDPRIRKFIDYDDAAPEGQRGGISVAKPFGMRVIGHYGIGQVFPAFLPTQGTEDYVPPSPVDVYWRVGQNPGTCSTSEPGGHPQTLDDTIEEMVDHNDKFVNWMLIDSAGGVTRRAKIHTDSADVECDSEIPTYSGVWCDIEFLDGPDTETYRAFYYDLELGDILTRLDPVSVSWSDYLPEDPGDSTFVGPNGVDLQQGWLIITWPCPEDAAEVAPPAPLCFSNSDFNNDFSCAFGGPTGEFSNDFDFSFDNNLFNDAFLEDLTADSDVIGVWKLQETTDTNAVDSGQNGNDGTASGDFATDSVTGPGGKYDRALRLNAADDVNCGDLLIGPTVLSCFIWAKNDLTNLLATNVLVGHYYTTGNQRSWVLELLTSEKIRINLSSDGSTDNYWDSTDAIADLDVWHHFGFVYDGDGNTLTVYLDGAAVAGAMGSGSVPNSLHNSTADLYLGALGAGSSQWDGDIAAAVVATRTLTAAEIEALYRAGT